MSKMFPIIDLHCDLLVYLLMNSKASPHTQEMGAGLPYLKAGHVGLQVMAIYTAVEQRSSEYGLAQSAIYGQMLKDYPEDFFQADANFEVEKDSRVATVAALESASGICNEEEPLENAFKNLETVLKNVERLFYISLTHHDENRFGGGNYSSVGLKDDGRALLDYMDGKQIAIDLSHTSDELAHDILDYTYKRGLNVPVIASHSNFRDLWDHPRNLTKENAQEIIDRGGLIGMNFLRAFLNETEPNAILDHIKYGMSLENGASALCFGADFFFTGDFPNPERDPYYFPNLENATKYQGILDDLRDSLTEVQKERLAYKNVQDFIASNWS